MFHTAEAENWWYNLVGSWKFISKKFFFSPLMIFESLPVERYFSVLRFNSCYQRDINRTGCTLLQWEGSKFNGSERRKRCKTGSVLSEGNMHFQDGWLGKWEQFT